MNILLYASVPRPHWEPLLSGSGCVQAVSGQALPSQSDGIDAVLIETAVFSQSSDALRLLLAQCRDRGLAVILIGAVPAGLPPHPAIYPLPPSPDPLVVTSLLAAIHRQAANHRETVATEARLSAVKAILAEERQMARHALEQFITPDQLPDPALHVWSRAAHRFSGDLILAARTPANVLHLMLIDNMSSGTGAMASALPVIAPFYRMTEKGFSIDAIVREANARIFRLSPDRRSVPATLVSVDFSDGVIHVWNGGTPGPLLLNCHSDAVLETVPRGELGLMSPESFNAATDVWTFSDEYLLVLGSRGLLRHLEIENSSTAECLARWLREHGECRFEQLKTHDMLNFTDIPEEEEGVEGEDLSLILVHCQRDITMPQGAGTLVARHAASGEWQLTLCISPDEMRGVDIVPLLLGVLGQFEATRAMTGMLFVVLSELYNNALDHGILGLDSSLKRGPDGMGVFLEERAQRLAALKKGQIELTLSQASTPEGLVLSVICTDSGPGFNHAEVCQRQPAEMEILPYGRGLALIKSLASSIEFNSQGNRLHVRLAITPNEA